MNKVEERKVAHAADVLNHIKAHHDKGEEAAVAKHMAAPEHKAIVEAAEAADEAADTETPEGSEGED